jgi:hypothetical protein
VIVIGFSRWLWTEQEPAQVQQLAPRIVLISTILFTAGIEAVKTAIVVYMVSNISTELT